MDPSSSPDIANNSVIKMLTEFYRVLLRSFSLHCMILRHIVITAAELLRHLPADLTTGSLSKGHFSFRSERGKKCGIISRKRKTDTGTNQSSSVFTCSTCRSCLNLQTRQERSENKLHLLFDFGTGPYSCYPVKLRSSRAARWLCVLPNVTTGEGATEAPG